MAKARKISKRGRPKKRPIPAKSESSPRLSFKRIVLSVAFGVAVIGLGVYFYCNRAGQTDYAESGPPVGDGAVLVEEPNLTPEEEIAALKQEEMEVAESVLSAFPESAGALEMMANLHSRHGRRSEALPLWEKCLTKDPNLLSIHRNLGNAAVDGGQFETAIERFRAAIEIAPEVRGLHEELGYALLETGRCDEAIKALQEELRLSPQSVKTHFLLGQTYLEQKKYSAARKHYEAAIELSPEYSSAYYGLVRVYTALKEPEKAKQYEEKFRAYKDRILEGHRAGRGSANFAGVDLGAVRQSVVSTLVDAHKLYLAGRDAGKAEEVLRRALDIDPNSIQSMERLALLYNMTNRPESALRLFERIGTVDPSNSYNYLNMGSIATKLGRYSDAEKAYEKAIELAPEQPAGYRMLAQSYLTRGVMAVRALEFAGKAASIEASAGNLFVFAWASDVNGNRSEALRAIEEAIRLDPKNSRYRQVYERIKGGN